MDDIVFLSHYTSSGLAELLKMDADLFEIALESAIKLHEIENKTSD